MQMRFIVRQLAHIAVLSYPATLFSGPACGLSILNALLEIIKAIKILLTLLTFWKDYLALDSESRSLRATRRSRLSAR